MDPPLQFFAKNEVRNKYECNKYEFLCTSALDQ